MTAKQRQAARTLTLTNDLTFGELREHVIALVADVERWKELAKDVVELSHGKNDRWLQAIERALAEDEA